MAPSTESSPLLAPEPPIERVSQKHSDAIMDADAASAASSSSSASHRTSTILRDTIIGFSDGLTVPFALTAGLSSLGSAKLVIMGGLAELFSGMISMGLGAYLAAVTERDAYCSRERQCEHDAKCGQEMQRNDVFAVLHSYSVSRPVAERLAADLCHDRPTWVRFMMQFCYGLEKPDSHGAWISAVTMGLSYFIGGLIPMIPYFLMARVRDALVLSIAVTVVVLLIFGYVKNYVAIRNHRAGIWGAVETLIIGMLAAGTSYGIVRLLDRTDS